MKKIIWISDFFISNVWGGAEIVDSEIIKSLRESGHDVKEISCSEFEYKSFVGSYRYIVSNFTNLSEKSKKYLIDREDYSIVEHDHKYLEERHPTKYKNFIVPPNKIINREFYNKAKVVYCQSKLHAEVVSSNLGLKNVVNLSTCIWSNEHLDLIEKNSNQKKNSKAMVLGSNNPIKNTRISKAFCEENSIDYDVVGPLPYEELISQMAKYDKLVFFPGVLETYNRLIVEARMLNCNLVTNNLNGCTSESWFKNLKGVDLINFLRDSRSKFIDKFVNMNNLDFFNVDKKPKVSIITSMFKPGKNLKPFLDDIVNQTYFESCELIIIDVNSTDAEKAIIKSYEDKYPNIIYNNLLKDPGIYGCWNEAIKLSSGKYLTNANLDDRRSNVNIEHAVRFLENNPEIDLVYSEAYLTEKPLETYEKNSSSGKVYPILPFSKEAMIKCLPGCMPLWKKSIHDKVGLFDDKYKSAGDWEMWLRMVSAGSIFHKLDGIYGLYYMNPEGMSTSEANSKSKLKEECEVFENYKHIFGEKIYNLYYNHFHHKDLWEQAEKYGVDPYMQTR